MKKLLFLTKGLILFAGISLVYSCTKSSTKPTQPENVTASNKYALKVELNWDAVKGADSYDIYRAKIGTAGVLEDLNYTLIGSSETNSYEDISVDSKSSYSYKIKAVRDDQSSDFSESVSGATTVLSADEAFTALAKYTKGKRYDARSASEVPVIINNVIDSHAVSSVDLVFLIDNTGSMSDDIDQVKKSLSGIIANLPSNTRLGMAIYNDKNVDPTNWYKNLNLTTDFTKANQFLNSISVDGGGDLPESVYDGIYRTVDELSWASKTKRMIIVIGDAPPLEGSLSDRTLKEVVDKCLSMSIDANLYPILISSGASFRKN
jgi:hypothetical protein